ncbi:MAG: Glu/Leu/Phe/Val dehydrogenase dimerization domain-containing protein [Candidatus Andeanibacterium colombiense]|uniref:Glu/Leu/Phe/Val dehydrogenase dimerization domain-containing protein n=1 Tax=Candidatus Andeanibacterium colombiense TaxID=3121345 RepID=A0AAJ5X023_9SPHN|nr:MAG: Glu/Leu/Phe/Val dehydrogenase dimerization domain-containing protein [Sphingomonadaceae bacterium]
MDLAAADSPAATFVPLKDEAAGLDGVIALHSAALGPGAGGCRFWDYPTAEAAQVDAARLAQGMSYKNAMAGLPFGGGKAVLRKPSGGFDRAALFRAFGRAVEDLGGRYITAEDVGTTPFDMGCVAGQTRYVAGLPRAEGETGGDPSPWTARGVFISMKLAAEYQLGKPLSACSVAIQGVGNVGAALARLLALEGARLIVADVHALNAARTAEETLAEIVEPGAIVAAEADIFSPCALGGVLDRSTIPQLKARIVCGAANNQLATAQDGRALADRGVLYAPDYVVNAGGIINVAGEYLGWDAVSTANRVERIAMRLMSVLNHADEARLPTNLAADALAQQILADARAQEPAL